MLSIHGGVSGAVGRNGTEDNRKANNRIVDLSTKELSSRTSGWSSTPTDQTPRCYPREEPASRGNSDDPPSRRLKRPSKCEPRQHSHLGNSKSQIGRAHV